MQSQQPDSASSRSGYKPAPMDYLNGPPRPLSGTPRLPTPSSSSSTRDSEPLNGFPGSPSYPQSQSNSASANVSSAASAGATPTFVSADSAARWAAIEAAIELREKAATFARRTPLSPGHAATAAAVDAMLNNTSSIDGNTLGDSSLGDSLADTGGDSAAHTAGDALLQTYHRPAVASASSVSTNTFNTTDGSLRIERNPYILSESDDFMLPLDTLTLNSNNSKSVNNNDTNRPASNINRACDGERGARGAYNGEPVTASDREHATDRERGVVLSRAVPSALQKLTDAGVDIVAAAHASNERLRTVMSQSQAQPQPNPQQAQLTSQAESSQLVAQPASADKNSNRDSASAGEGADAGVVVGQVVTAICDGNSFNTANSSLAATGSTSLAAASSSTSGTKVARTFLKANLAATSPRTSDPVTAAIAAAATTTTATTSGVINDTNAGSGTASLGIGATTSVNKLYTSPEVVALDLGLSSNSTSTTGARAKPEGLQPSFGAIVPVKASRLPRRVPPSVTATATATATGTATAAANSTNIDGSNNSNSNNSNSDNSNNGTCGLSVSAFVPGGITTKSAPNSGNASAVSGSNATTANVSTQNVSGGSPVVKPHPPAHLRPRPPQSPPHHTSVSTSAANVSTSGTGVSVLPRGAAGTRVILQPRTQPQPQSATAATAAASSTLTTTSTAAASTATTKLKKFATATSQDVNTLAATDEAATESNNETAAAAAAATAAVTAAAAAEARALEEDGHRERARAAAARAQAERMARAMATAAEEEEERVKARERRAHMATQPVTTTTAATTAASATSANSNVTANGVKVRDRKTGAVAAVAHPNNTNGSIRALSQQEKQHQTGVVGLQPRLQPHQQHQQQQTPVQQPKQQPRAGHASNTFTRPQPQQSVFTANHRPLNNNPCNNPNTATNTHNNSNNNNCRDDAASPSPHRDRSAARCSPSRSSNGGGEDGPHSDGAAGSDTEGETETQAMYRDLWEQERESRRAAERAAIRKAAARQQRRNSHSSGSNGGGGRHGRRHESTGDSGADSVSDSLAAGAHNTTASHNRAGATADADAQKGNTSAGSSLNSNSRSSGATAGSPSANNAVSADEEAEIDRKKALFRAWSENKEREHSLRQKQEQQQEQQSDGSRKGAFSNDTADSVSTPATGNFTHASHSNNNNNNHAKPQQQKHCGGSDSYGADSAKSSSNAGAQCGDDPKAAYREWEKRKLAELEKCRSRPQSASTPFTSSAANGGSVAAPSEAAAAAAAAAVAAGAGLAAAAAAAAAAAVAEGAPLPETFFTSPNPNANANSTTSSSTNASSSSSSSSSSQSEAANAARFAYARGKAANSSSGASAHANAASSPEKYFQSNASTNGRRNGANASSTNNANASSSTSTNSRTGTGAGAGAGASASKGAAHNRFDDHTAGPSGIPASSEAFYDKVYGAGASSSRGGANGAWGSFGNFRNSNRQNSGAGAGAGPSSGTGFSYAGFGNAGLDAWRAGEAKKREQFEVAEASWARFELLAAAAGAAGAGASASATTAAAGAGVTTARGGAAGRQLRLSEVPWPRDKFDLTLSTWTGEERKSQFRRLMLRWHPDKWMQAYGGVIVAEEREAAMERVTEVAKLINTLRNA